MVEMYCKLLISKRRPFTHVPDLFKGKVEARLKELGYNTNGDPFAVEE